ncbi:MAG: PKD domain-containing protein [Bacteroidota bacterium]
MNHYLYLFLLLVLGASLPAQSVTQLVLVDATTDEDIGPLMDGSTIDLTAVGTSLNVRAEVSGTVGSIRFSLDGQTNFQTENVAPYALAGDTGGNYNAWTPALGTHILTATAYTGSGASGSVLNAVTVNFTVTEEEVEIEVPADPGTGAVTVSGELKKWHKVTLSFDGPFYSELNAGVNPFLDYRLIATFTNGEKTYEVPGYFAADGNAAETSAGEGNVWRVHFAPDEVGTWTYTISFRLGSQVAISTVPGAGTALPPIDGITGTLEIGESDKSIPDNRARGRLQYVGQRYLRYAETGEYFLKGGADAPENFLAYEDFDNTPNAGGRRKSWAPHAADWNAGDPSWQGGKGTEIIGAVNYLAGKGVNVFSFLTMNIQGDDRNVFPYLSDANFRRFDCSKLDQWEIVLEHADQLGMYLHFKTQETENDQLLDGGALGVDRKLYYRELLARFGHHLALNWNMGEENTQTTAQRIAMADWFASQDPYQHNRVIHTYPGQINAVYSELVGDQSDYTGVSIQTNWNQVHSRTADWVENSQAAGKPWIVANDEQGNANTGVPPDPGYPGYNGSNPDLHDIRQQVLWGNLMAGGAGVEYYFGYQLPESDLSLQDYRSRDLSWDYIRYALSFFRALPFSQMDAHDDWVTNGWCFAQENQSYAVYLPDGGITSLQLVDNGVYNVQWYNPRTGTFLLGAVESVSGPGIVDLGESPADPEEDWAILVTRDPGTNQSPVALFTTSVTTGPAPLTVFFDATDSYDPDGTIALYSWNFGDGTITEGITMNHTYEEAGTYIASLRVSDNAGAVATQEVTIVVTESNPINCETSITLYARDFPYEDTNFYLDDFTNMDLLGINPEQHQSAEVAQVFNGEDCVYDLTFHGVGESDGQSRFKLFINDNFLGAIELPLSMQDWELGPAYNTTFPHVPLNQGDEIRVYAEVDSDGQEYSRARWLKIDCIPAAGSGDCAAIWEEQDGLLVIEMENNELIESWESATTVPEYTGDSYIQWTGDDHYNATGNGVLRYPIQINNPGTYIFDWRVGVGFGDDSTEHNDSWVKIQADNYYAEREQNGSLVKPRPACDSDPDYGCPNGNTRDGFFKVYGGPLEGWTWRAFTSDNEPHIIHATFAEPGLYEIEVNARSSYHRIDRMVLYHEDLVSQNSARQLSNEETRCEDSGLYQLTFIVGDGNQALANATVTVAGQDYLTQADGSVTITNLSSGLLAYAVNLGGYVPQASEILLSRNTTILLTLDAVTTAEDIEMADVIRLYPNPAQDHIYVELPTTEQSQIRVLGLNGQILRTQFSQQRLNPVDVSLLPAGTYIIEVISDGWRTKALFVKAR